MIWLEILEQSKMIKITNNNWSLLDVFGDGFGSFRYSMSSKFSGEDELDSWLNFSGWKSSSLVESNKFGSFSSNSVKGIMNERVHDVHGLLGDTNIRVNLFQNFVDVDRESLNSSSSSLLFSFSSCLFFCHMWFFVSIRIISLVWI